MAKVFYTKMRYWRKIGAIEQTLGNHPTPYVGAPYRLTIRYGLMYYRCVECGNDILQGERHAAKTAFVNGESKVIRFCMECVVPVKEKPATIYAKEPG